MNPISCDARCGGCGWAAWLLVVVGLTGCQREPSPLLPSSTTPLSSNEVARVGDAVLTREAFQTAVNQSGGTRGKEQVLEEWIQTKAMAWKARETGLDRDPAMAASLERMLAGTYQERQLAARLAALPAVTDEEIHAYYEAHRDSYTTPAMVRGAVLFMQLSPKATNEAKADLRSRAAALLEACQAADDAEFRQLVQRHSEDQATRYVGGDMGWLKHGEPQSRWDPKVTEALATLETPGSMGPILETERGIHLVRLTDRKPAAVRPLSELREAIVYLVTREREEQARREFLSEVRAGVRVEVNEAALTGIREPNAPSAIQPPDLPNR